MLLEYRRYQVAPGRRPRLDQRFEELTLPLWERHGIRPLGIWEADVGRTDDLHYVLEWADHQDRVERFGAMQRDPEWVEGRARSEDAGPLLVRVENQLWRPTSYSPRKESA